MEKDKNTQSVWWELSTGGPCMLLRRLIDRRNAREFDPFVLLAMCYCSPEFERSDVVAPHIREDREALNYLVTGLEDPPEILDEKARVPQDSHWINVVGGLMQQDPTKSVHVLNMELWMHVLPGADGGGKRWEFDSEDVPLVHWESCDVRVVCGEFQGKDGAISNHPLGTLILDVTLTQGAEFDFTVPEENTTFVYVFGGQARFGRDSQKHFGKDALLRARGGEIYASTLCTGGRFLLFSARPVERKNPAPCPDKNDEICRINKK